MRWQEARQGLAMVEDVLWHAVPRHFRTVDEELRNRGASLHSHGRHFLGAGQPPLPPNAALIRVASWMVGAADLACAG
jgi:hypothetical protein